MQLMLLRRWFYDDYTIGELMNADGPESPRLCYTLEDQVRSGPKINGQTAIPAGRYKIQITESVRFKRRLPLLLDVPGFSGIRIHCGNTAEDTEGCLLVGLAKEGRSVRQSRLAFNRLFQMIDQAITAGDSVSITIVNRPTPELAP